MKYHVTVAGRGFEVDLTGPVPRVDGVDTPAEISTIPGTTVRHLDAAGSSHSLLATNGEEGRWEIFHRGSRYEVEVLDERSRAIREMSVSAEAEGPRTILAPMPGLVLRVDVEAGDTVTAGQGLLVVEAMKMENELKAPADGVVVRVSVTAGQPVEKGAVLVILE